ncbi:hypothetical protein SAMN06296416_1071, partial [Pseudoxanthomonas wuyuanensis]
RCGRVDGGKRLAKKLLALLLVFGAPLRKLGLHRRGLLGTRCRFACGQWTAQFIDEVACSACRTAEGNRGGGTSVRNIATVLVDHGFEYLAQLARGRVGQEGTVGLALAVGVEEVVHAVGAGKHARGHGRRARVQRVAAGARGSSGLRSLA